MAGECFAHWMIRRSYPDRVFRTGAGVCQDVDSNASASHFHPIEVSSRTAPKSQQRSCRAEILHPARVRVSTLSLRSNRPFVFSILNLLWIFEERWRNTKALERRSKKRRDQKTRATTNLQHDSDLPPNTVHLSIRHNFLHHLRFERGWRQITEEPEL
jgi:hypothetical protein